jgi:hypothetical protein
MTRDVGLHCAAVGSENPRMRRLRDRHHIDIRQPVEMPFVQCRTAFPGELAMPQQAVRTNDRASLLPGRRHQLLLALLHDSSPQCRHRPGRRVQIELREPAGGVGSRYLPCSGVPAAIGWQAERQSWGHSGTLLQIEQGPQLRSEFGRGHRGRCVSPSAQCTRDTNGASIGQAGRLGVEHDRQSRHCVRIQSSEAKAVHEFFEIAGWPGGKFPAVVDRQLDRSGRRVPRRPERPGVDRLSEPGLHALRERRHQGRDIAGVGGEAAGAEEAAERAGRIRSCQDCCRIAGTGNLDMNPGPRLRQVRQFRGRIIQRQNRQRAARTKIETGRVAPDCHQHQPGSELACRIRRRRHEGPWQVRRINLHHGEIIRFEVHGARRRIGAQDLPGVE